MPSCLSPRFITGRWRVCCLHTSTPPHNCALSAHSGARQYRLPTAAPVGSAPSLARTRRPCRSFSPRKYWSFGGAPGANVSQILADSNNPANLAWQQAYTKWDAYASWESANGKYTVTGFAKNIGDKVVLANYTDPYVSLEAPKTFGLTFNAQFQASACMDNRAGGAQVPPAFYMDSKVGQAQT